MPLCWTRSRRRPPGWSREHRDVVLSNEAFDRFIAELDKPAEAVGELVDLFRRYPKLAEE